MSRYSDTLSTIVFFKYSEPHLISARSRSKLCFVSALSRSRDNLDSARSRSKDWGEGEEGADEEEDG